MERCYGAGFHRPAAGCWTGPAPGFSGGTFAQEEEKLLGMPGVTHPGFYPGLAGGQVPPPLEDLPGVSLRNHRGQAIRSGPYCY